MFFKPVNETCAHTKWFPSRKYKRWQFCAGLIQAFSDLGHYNYFPFVWHTLWKWDAVIAVSPVKVSVCVSSSRRTAEGREAITSRHLWRWLWRHCWGPAVVNMGAPGANRAERTTLSPWAFGLGCCAASSNTASARLPQRQKVNMISIHHHLLFKPLLLPTFFCPLPHTVRSGLMVARR